MNDWGSKRDIPYAFRIKNTDRDSVLNIIKTGLKDKIPKECFEKLSEEYYETQELCNTEKGISFVTLISNVKELERYVSCSRGLETILVIFGESKTHKEFSDAQSILHFYIDE